jgi:hypothetical protein
MESQQSFSTSDLRSHSKEYQRDKEHKVKWQYGETLGYNGQNPSKPRPLWPARTPPSVLHQIDKARNSLKHKNDISYENSDSSADEDVEEASTAPVPDAEITYSFDAARGPSHGSEILGQALEQAIERYEVRQTDKLIKEEYEVLDADGEPAGTTRKNSHKTEIVEEEDYLIVQA